MPLSAIIDGKRMISTMMSDQEWEDCRALARSDQSKVLMAYSGLPCIPKASSTGLRFFAKRKGQTPGVPYVETKQHIALKEVVVRAAVEAGWDASTEVMSRDKSWVADTLMTKDRVSVVFEIQWSGQSVEDYERRQRRYDRAGVKCIWIYKDSAREEGYRLKSSEHMPLFEISNRSKVLVEDPLVYLNDFDRQISVRELVIGVLENAITFSYEASVQIQKMPCPSCDVDSTVWLMTINGTSTSTYQKSKLETSPATRLVVSNYVTESSLPPMALMDYRETRYSNGRYPAYICPVSGCHQVLGETYVHKAIWMREGPIPELRVSGLPEDHQSTLRGRKWIMLT